MIVRMVASLLVLSLFALSNARCKQEEPIATSYKRSLSESNDAGVDEERPAAGTNDDGASPSSDKEADSSNSQSPNPQTETGSDTGEDPKLVGDPAKGKTIITGTCQAVCHTPSGPAKKVILNAKIIGDLDVAIQIPMYKVYHDGIRVNFEGQNRADLEAALKTIP